MFSSESGVGLRIAVVGLGYVGCVTAACLAKLGNRVAGIDTDKFKVEKVCSGDPPFHEPGLGEILREAVDAGYLTATDSLEEGVRDADIAMLCVGTPSASNGNLSLDQIRRVCVEIRDTLAERSKPLVIAVRSTVFPGTCEDVVLEAVERHPLVSVASNPEFLREGTAVQDFFEPSLSVIGASETAVAESIAAVYANLPGEPRVVSLRTAELIKYACNAFHAVKIAFANEIGTIAAHADIDPVEVMDTLCQDERLNISRAYLRPGMAFGGSCLPKDLRALSYRSARMDLDLPLLTAAMPSNEAHLKRAIDAALALPGKRIGVFGLAFKDNTDDLRESPVVALIERLLGKGREIRVYDPHIRTDEIYGSNKAFVLNALPHIGKWMVSSPAELAEWADHLIVTQRPKGADGEAIANSGKPVLPLTEVPPPVKG